MTKEFFENEETERARFVPDQIHKRHVDKIKVPPPKTSHLNTQWFDAK
jgi:hypothetical protein